MMPPKSQKELMLAGELYLANDPELVAARRRAELLTAAFNQTPDAEQHGAELLRQLFHHFGRDSVVRPALRCDYGFNISVGERSFINFDCVLLDCQRITIGNEVQIAPGVHLYTATHPLDAGQRRAGLEFARPITIGDGVWLGGGVRICPGVTIGENTVIGAGSVVTKDLPPHVLAFGNPCRVNRSL
jgi:maltose O-acetyltransferase